MPPTLPGAPGSFGPYFRTSRQFMGPPWLVSNGESQLVGYTLDTLKDQLTERTRQSLLARFPQQDPYGTPASDDALAAIGRDRRIVRGINESSASYAARLLLWLDTWNTAGNPITLLKQLAAYCGPLPNFRTVDVRGNWYSLTGGVPSVSLNQGNWDWDGNPLALTYWSRFWIIIYPNGLWSTGSTWGDGSKWGDGRTWGSTATLDQVQTIRGIVRDWKPAGTTCVNIILAFDNSSFNPATARDGAGLPDGTWGNWGKTVNGQNVPARLSTARYWDGV